MSDEADKLRCTFGCWAMGGVAGALAIILLVVMGAFSWPGAIFSGGLIGVAVALVLTLALCTSLPTPAEARDRLAASQVRVGTDGPIAAQGLSAVAGAVAGRAPEASARPEAAAPHGVAEAGVAEAGVAEAAETAVTERQAMAAVAGISAGAGAERESFGATDTRDAAGAGAATDAAPQGGMDAAAGAVADPFASVMDAKAGTTAEVAPRPGTDPVPGTVPESGTKPALLTAPREGGADNLKEIKGVGPKMEGMLHALGVYHFDQVASWTPVEVAWVDDNLQGFKGRIVRDNWVEQAKILASGGETEFSRKFDQG